MGILLLVVLVVWMLLGVLTVVLLNLAKVLVRSAARRTMSAPPVIARVDAETSVRFAPSVPDGVPASWPSPVSHHSA